MGVVMNEVSTPTTFDGTAAPGIDIDSLSGLITMAVRSTGAAIGGLSIVHLDHIWIPVRVGHVNDLLTRSGSFCGTAVDSCLEWFEIEDAAQDECFRTHPLVAGVPTYRHYAAVPINIESIRLHGTVWVMWQPPGSATAEQADTLRLVAGLVMETLTSRYCNEVTGIVNQPFFIHSLQTMVEASKVRMTIGYVNLRSFSRFNGVYGHIAGNELLTTIGERLLAWAQPDGLVAHLGGDRFGFALAGSQTDLSHRVAALHDVLAAPIALGGQHYTAEARIGLREAGVDCDEHASVLLQEAAVAAASLSVASTRSYDAASRRESHMLVELSELLSQRPGHGQLEVHYEPQVDVRRGRLAGFEALVRWRHPTAGLLPPNDFVGLAESLGKIVALDTLVLRQVCRDIGSWRDEGVNQVPIALNFARESLLSPSMTDILADLLHTHGIEGAQIECEITESQCMDTPGLQTRLETLRKLGVRIAIDDFGTGHSNLETIRQLSFDKLKVDRQFVHGVADDARLAGLVRMIANIARLFNAEVLCEGVEQVRDLQWLTDHDFYRFQGWYFSPPLYGTAVIEALRQLADPAEPLGYRELREKLLGIRHAAQYECGLIE